jgi:ribonuclease HII
METKYSNNEFEVGIDEAGRGPLIGRVYAGAVIWGNNTTINPIIKDSKKLSKKKRAIALEWIKSNVKAWGVGYAEPDEIDKINILEATKLAMDRAIQNLITNFNLNPNNITLIIDGSGWEKKFDYNVKSFIKGDSKYYSIAAASILAKEHHDEYIKNLCSDLPDLNEKYSLLSNMGYGTAAHIAGLKTHGPCPYHRKSFKPISEFIKNPKNLDL